MRPLAHLMDLTSRLALVTAGTGHIGLSVCETLLEMGADLAVPDLDAGNCAARVKAMAGSGSARVVAVPCDLRDEVSTRNTILEVTQELGRLDILVQLLLQ